MTTFAETSPAARAWSFGESTPAARRESIVMVRWALIIACTYLVLFSEGSAGADGLGGLVVVFFMASNLVIGRLPAQLINTQQFKISIALLDTALIVASLFLAGQLMVEVVVLCLGILILAIAGLRLGVIAAATLAMTGAYLLIVWMTGEHGGQALWRSSMLLRVPFLLCAAMVYSWATEASRGDGVSDHTQSPGGAALTGVLSVQLEAIRRCQAALAQGSPSLANAALEEITAKNQEMQAAITGL